MSCVVRLACGKTSTKNRVDAAVIHFESLKSLAVAGPSQTIWQWALSQQFQFTILPKFNSLSADLYTHKKKHAGAAGHKGSI